MMIKRLDGERAETAISAFNKRWFVNSENTIDYNMFLFNADSVENLFALLHLIKNDIGVLGDVKGMDCRKRRIIGIKSERGCTLFIQWENHVEVVYERSMFEDLEHAIAV